MSTANAPHLPEETPRIPRLRVLFVAVLFLSLFAGFAGGMYGMRFLLPGILERVLGALPLPPITARDTNKKIEPIPFAGMSNVTYEFGKTMVGEESGGLALGFTSDGWLIALKSNLDHNKFVFDAAHKAHPIETIINDPHSEVAFIKVGGQNFNVPAINESLELNAGDLVYLISPKDGIMTAQISSIYGILDTTVIDAEQFSRMIFLDRPLPDNLSGVPVFTSAGALIGIVNSRTTKSGNATVIPNHNFVASFRSAAKEGKVTIPYLGVRVAVTEGAHIDIAHEPSGIKIVGNKSKGLPAIKPKSPATIAGLQEGDSIVMIEQDEIGRSQTLAEVLSAYRPDQQITITIERNGHRETKKVTLGKL